MKYWIAADVLGKGHVLSEAERAELVEKHTQKDDTPKKAKKRLSNVLTVLRKGGYYMDEYARGRKVRPSPNGEGAAEHSTKQPTTQLPQQPQTPSTKPSTPNGEGSGEGRGGTPASVEEKSKQS